MSGSLVGAVFGYGIHQAPYQAEYRADEWQDPDRRPLFTLAELPLDLPVILRRWRDLASGENPFLELYSQAILHADLPHRARFLYLVQALVGLHGYEHRSEDDARQESFEKDRAAVLDDVAGSNADIQSISFIKKNWSKRMPDSLDRRIADLVNALPERVGKTLIAPAMAELAAELATRGGTSLGGQFRVLRNDLSHGARNYDSATLRPWVNAAETLCRAHALRLLGFEPHHIDSALVNHGTA